MPIPFRTLAQARAALQLARAHLDRGRLLAYPTETVYGIGGAISPQAVRALHELKSRGAEKAFLVLVGDRDMADRLDVQWTEVARQLAARYWPGPMTLVLRTSDSSPLRYLRGEQGGVGVRHTSHVILASFLREYGHPLTSTSANSPGAPAARDAGEVESYFGALIQRSELMLLDGGPLQPSPPSTVIDCTSDVPRMLREGAITDAEIRSTTPSLIGIG